MIVVWIQMLLDEDDNDVLDRIDETAMCHS